jgi:hypothetical protein
MYVSIKTRVRATSEMATGILSGETGDITWDGEFSHQTFLLDELWKEVMKEVPEISWIDISSKKQWWLKVWAPGERNNPQHVFSGRAN